MTRSIRPRGASLEELRAEAKHAAQRVALYRRKVLLGRGDVRELAELRADLDGSRGSPEARRGGAMT